MNEAKTEWRDPIERIAGGYRDTQVLLTANRLRVFEILGRDAMSLQELAQTLHTSARGTRILCDALVGLSLLEKHEERYRNSPVALEFLLPDSPDSRVNLLWHTTRLYERWGRLHYSVETGQPVAEEAIDPELRFCERDFALAMHDSGRAASRRTAEVLDLGGVARLLDVGGGPGQYAIEFARRYPDLRVVLLDSEITLEIARANVLRAGLTDRIDLRVGDVFRDDIGQGYDFILLSNLIHAYSYGENASLVQKCASALVAGGRLCVKDFILDADRTSPLGAALFALNMLVNTEGGDCYTLEQVGEWFVGAGLTLDRWVALPPHSRLVIGRRPE